MSFGDKAELNGDKRIRNKIIPPTRWIDIRKVARNWIETIQTMTSDGT